MSEKKRSFPIGTSILTLLAIVTLPAIIIRYVSGLGAMTDLSDGRAWGIWISFDLYCGVALAAGGFTLCGIVYVFQREKYHIVARPAVMTAFLGYLLVVFALLVDVGQPWYIWRIIFDWNLHSPLFEVAVCVMAYTTVLALEFSPVVFERLNLQVPLKAIRVIQIPLVIAGICLSTLHQSSLGSMLLMMPNQLNELWYTPVLPIIFLTTAIAVGPAMVIFESTWSSKAFGHKISQDVLGGLAKGIPYALGIALLLRVGEIAIRGDIDLIFTQTPENILWWIEVVGGLVLPIILFSRASVRESRTKVFLTACLVIGGLMLHRFDVSWFQLAGRPDTTYFPTFFEIMVSVGLVADAMLVIQWANRTLPIMVHEVEHKTEPKSEGKSQLSASKSHA